MKKCLFSGLLLFCSIAFSIAQSDYEKQHEAYNYITRKNKIDSLYTVYSKVSPADKNYMEALFFRNQYGWALGKAAQLKNDIPAILNLPDYSKELTYGQVFRLQKFPRSEWERFYAMSDTLCHYFSDNKNVYRELLGIKTMLEFLLYKDIELVRDLPVLLSLLDSTSDIHASLTWQYGQALLRTDQRPQALIVFEKTYFKTGHRDCFQTMIRMYGTDKSYDKIIALKSDILKDSSGVLLYDLGKAYLNTNQQKEAAFYFNAFMSKIEFSPNPPYAQIHYDNTMDHISAEQLETLGDFYSSSDKKRACTYYKLSIKILSDSNPDIRFEKTLAATDDEKQREKLQQKYNDYLKSQEAAIASLVEKSKQCK